MSNQNTENHNKLNPAVLKALTKIRATIQEIKKDLSDFVDGKDEAINTRTDDLENATCEQSTVTDNRLADIENAICELSEQIITEKKEG